MKRLILSAAIMLGLAGIAGAQSSGSNASNSPSVGRTTTPSSKQAASDSLNNRKVYKWKDGQRATPTGHEATGTNGGYAAIAADSAIAPRDSTKQ